MYNFISFRGFTLAKILKCYPSCNVTVAFFSKGIYNAGQRKALVTYIYQLIQLRETTRVTTFSQNIPNNAWKWTNSFTH